MTKPMFDLPRHIPERFYDAMERLDAMIDNDPTDVQLRELRSTMASLQRSLRLRPPRGDHFYEFEYDR